MEASQPRVKPIRTSEQPEQILSRPLPPSIGDANLRELPQRPLSVAEPTPTTKPQTKGRRASQRKPVMAFRQHWVTPGKLLADGIQQWESQAEWINQQLAERIISQSEARSPQPSAEPETARSIVSRTQLDTQPEVQIPILEDEEADRLQSKMAQVRQIVSDLDSAIAEGGTLTEGNGILPLLSNPVGSPLTPLSVVENEAPKVADSKVADREMAQQEAAQTAATLRHLAERARSTPPPPPVADLPTPVSPASDLPTPDLQLSREWIQSQDRAAVRVRRSRRRKFRLRDLLQLPQRPVDRVVDALTWVVLAGVARIGIRLLLMVLPVLSPVAIGLMLLPAAIGLFLLLLVPKAGYLPVYRLFLITLGLLLGGKL